MIDEYNRPFCNDEHLAIWDAAVQYECVLWYCWIFDTQASTKTWSLQVPTFRGFTSFHEVCETYWRSIWKGGSGAKCKISAIKRRLQDSRCNTRCLQAAQVWKWEKPCLKMVLISLSIYLHLTCCCCFIPFQRRVNYIWKSGAVGAAALQLNIGWFRL